ncbi:hypothetical protein HGM15179_003969 [Zosterops borbonicus]|uniref:Uncharacterized protein n=1 Tax=Zosterops borbonicus TaxID=364589 RepID=A0A8K1GPX1_9PASS|nr:hypothetical protein HGM15179_003969 [Zosterops borbonicus]
MFTSKLRKIQCQVNIKTSSQFPLGRNSITWPQKICRISLLAPAHTKAQLWKWLSCFLQLLSKGEIDITFPWLGIIALGKREPELSRQRTEQWEQHRTLAESTVHALFTADVSLVLEFGIYSLVSIRTLLKGSVEESDVLHFEVLKENKWK